MKPEEFNCSICWNIYTDEDIICSNCDTVVNNF